MKDFDFLVSTFCNSIKTWDYFVNWSKVFSNAAQLEIILNKMNYLTGKEDLKEAFTVLFSSDPDIVKAFPVLLAIREQKIDVFFKDNWENRVFDFSKPNNTSENYFEFFSETGLANIFKKSGVKNLVDYVLGVEVGLDSNGRKNRVGILMQEIVEEHIKTFCHAHNFEYLGQSNSSAIFNKWGVAVKVNKTDRNFDFVIYNPENKKIKIIEVNFFNGGGSKLKSVCGEFKGLFDELKMQNIDFIWITDGLGWKSTQKPLEEAFNHLEYVFNLHLLKSGVLEKMTW